MAIQANFFHCISDWSVHAGGIMDALAIRNMSLARLTVTLNWPTNDPIDRGREENLVKSEPSDRAVRVQWFVRRVVPV